MKDKVIMKPMAVNYLEIEMLERAVVTKIGLIEDMIVESNMATGKKLLEQLTEWETLFRRLEKKKDEIIKEAVKNGRVSDNQGKKEQVQ